MSSENIAPTASIEAPTPGLPGIDSDSPTLRLPMPALRRCGPLVSEDNGQIDDEEFKSSAWNLQKVHTCSNTSRVEVIMGGGTTIVLHICGCSTSNTLHRRFHIRMTLCEETGLSPNKFSLYKIDDATEIWRVIQFGDYDEDSDQLVYIGDELILECSETFYKFIHENEHTLNWLLVDSFPHIHSDTNKKDIDRMSGLKDTC